MKKPPASDTSLSFAPDPNAVHVLAVGSSEGLPQLRRILGHTRWFLQQATTQADAVALLEHHASVVLISEATLPDGDWKTLLSFAQQLPVPPPLLVMAPHADECLWMDVLQSGGYNLLGLPLDPNEVFRSVSMAWLQLRQLANSRSRIRSASL